MDEFTKEAICFTLDLLTNDAYKQDREEYVEEMTTELGLDGWNELCGDVNTLIEVCKEIYRDYLNDESISPRFSPRGIGSSYNGNLMRV